MKKYNNIMVLLMLLLSNMPINGMEERDPQGPMDSTWFYDPHCIALTGNQFYQKQEWDKASDAYKNFLVDKQHSEYNKHKVGLNLASCLLAQGQATPHWACFDRLLNIAEDRLVPIMSAGSIFGNDKEALKELDLAQDELVWVSREDKNLVLVRTDQIGIGDIFHFISAVDFFIKLTNSKVTVSVPQFLKDTLTPAAEAYGFNIIGTKDDVPKTDYETHLISLLGYLQLSPSQLNPAKVVFTAPERAMNAVLEQIAGPLNLKYTVAAVFAGENRQAKLIGGKKLPNDAKSHGRHLNSEGFEALLDNYSKLMLIDCGTKASRITINKESNKDRCLMIADEKQAFDTIIALGSIMNKEKNIIGIGADNGPTNVFVRSLTNDGQDRMALITPNPQEYDARMENCKDKSDKYKQPISNAWIYKCKSPSIKHQTKMIERVYQDLTH